MFPQFHRLAFRHVPELRYSLKILRTQQDIALVIDGEDLRGTKAIGLCFRIIHLDQSSASQQLRVLRVNLKLKIDIVVGLVLWIFQYATDVFQCFWPMLSDLERGHAYVHQVLVQIDR